MKKFLSLLIVLTMMFTSSTVFADTIISEGVEVLENGDLLHYTITETYSGSQNMFDKHTTTKGVVMPIQYKNKSVSARFYLTSNNDTIATFGLDASFAYDGSNVEPTGSNAWGQSKMLGWTLQIGDRTTNVSPTYALAAGSYTLYKDGEFNNSASIRIYCDHLGDVDSYVD